VCWSAEATENETADSAVNEQIIEGQIITVGEPGIE